MSTADEVADADTAGLLALMYAVQRLLDGEAETVSMDELLAVRSVARSLRGAVEDEIFRRKTT